ncbi:MAG: hypothetical protein COB53_09395 [Elusimicrobia bacterium]|nr:MAG: hypothetical protein COB53_09395 [Elusimicrobiota bacterium]
MGKRLLLLLPTRTYKAKDFLDAARTLGADVIAASEEPSALEESAPDGLISFDFNNPQEAFQHGPFDAVVGVDDGSVRAAAVISAGLGLATNSPEAIDASRNKRLMREALKKAGVRTPAFAAASNTSPLPFPCVLKPESLSASRGVLRADNEEQYKEALKRIRAMPDVDEILVESYLPGKEVALEGLLSKGKLRTLALFDKPETPEGPTFPETIFVTPSALDEQTQEKIRDQAEKAAAALGLAEGPVHAELRVAPQGPTILELAARTIGGLCGRALTFGAGVSLEEIVLRHALGMDAALFERETQAAGACMINPGKTGILAGVEGTEAALAVDGIQEVIFPNRGDRPLEPLPEGGVYAGFIFAKGETPDAVVSSLKEARSLITLNYR